MQHTPGDAAAAGLYGQRCNRPDTPMRGVAGNVMMTETLADMSSLEETVQKFNSPAETERGTIPTAGQGRAGAWR